MSDSRHNVAWWALTPALVALLVRVAYAVSFADSPLFQTLAGQHDRTLYHEAAQGALWPEGAFEHLPLYPMLLHGVYALLGASLKAAAAFGIACDVLTTLLLVLLARRLGARPLFAAAAGLAYAVYPLAIAYSALTMPNTLNALLATAFAFALTHAPRDRWPAWFALGLLAGVAALGWAAWLLMVAALLIYWSVRRSSVDAPAWRALAAFTLAFALPLLPVAWHNSRAEGRFVLLTTHGGFNFYMGNHERATGHPVRVRDFRMTAKALLEDAHRAAEQDAGRAMTRAESSAWWSAQARAFWREQPRAALALSARKFMLFWNRADVDDLRMVEQARLLTGWFASPLWPGFGVFGLLGIIGLWRAPRAGALKVIALAGMASLVLYFITARYRLNLVPLLAALGAAGLAPLWSDLKARRYGLAGGTVLAALLFVGWPVKLRDLRAVDHYNAALQLIQAGRTNEAFALARDGLAIDPGFAALHHTMGALYFQRGMFREAVEAFARAAALDPAHPQAAFNLALSLARDGDPCGGREVLARAALQRPLAESAQRLLADLTSACGPR